MPVDNSSISVILRAFNEGLRIKAERDALAQRQYEFSAEQEEKGKERQQRAKEFDQRLAEESKQNDRMYQLTKLVRDMQASEEKRNILKGIATGEIAGSYSVPGNPVAPGLPAEFAVPSQKEDMQWDENLVIPKEQWVTPAEYYNQNPMLRQSRDLEQSRQAFNLSRELFRAQTQKEIANENNRVRKEISDEANEVRLDIAEINKQARIAQAAVKAETNEAARSKRSVEKANSMIQSYKKDKSYDIMSTLAADTKTAKEALANASKLNGLEDVRLMYMFVRSQDPNAVKEGELKLTREGAMTWLEQVGIKGYSFTSNNKILFTPEARRQMLRIVLDKNSKRFEGYDNDRQVFMNNLRLVNPDMANDVHVPDALSILRKKDSKEDEEIPTIKWEDLEKIRGGANGRK